MTLVRAMAGAIWQSVDGAPAALDAFEITGAGSLPSAFAVTDFACATIGAAALAVGELTAEANGRWPKVRVDRRYASLWFGMSLQPIGWTLPAAWDPIAGDYRARDGWIRLHTNAPHHRKAAQRVLGPHDDKAAMAKAVARWDKLALEQAILDAGGCAAEMRSLAEWIAHPQGQAVGAEPLVHAASGARGAQSAWRPTTARPLAGVRVLDLTRVLAGPVATRFLAGYGAEVLRIDPPDWNEPGVEPEVTLGKKCVGLDLRKPADRTTFEALLAKADIILHGYRPGALDDLGFGPDARAAIRPGLIDVCLDAYGWSGPWAARRGFDSLVQMSVGIAEAGMRWRGADVPVPLPVQALDHATGYLLAAAAIRAVTKRLRDGEGTHARLSLARTAKLLTDAGPALDRQPMTPVTDDDLADTIENTDWGPGRRVRPPVSVDSAPMRWDHPAGKLRTSAAAWDAAT